MHLKLFVSLNAMDVCFLCLTVPCFNMHICVVSIVQGLVWMFSLVLS
jgi:hypothetical protein